MTNDKDHILEIFAYHHWATDRVLAALSPVLVEQLDRPWGGSFKTGRGLLNHVVGVERLWLDRWRGQSPNRLPAFPATYSVQDFRTDWDETKSGQRRFLDAFTRERLESDLTYVNIEGHHRTYPFADILGHLVNHGTYHRGQLTHLLRDLGHSAPATDYLVFLEERKSW